VRTVFGAESDTNVAAELLTVLEEEDPSGVIEGRGVIPRREAA
jgi:hypothetical protein